MSIVKSLKVEDKEKILKAIPYLVDSNDSRFLIRSHGGQKEIAHLLKRWKKKKLQIHNARTNKKIQE